MPCLLAEMLHELPLHGADLLPRELRHRLPPSAAAPRAVVPQPLEVVRVDLDEQGHLLALSEGVPRRTRVRHGEAAAAVPEGIPRVQTGPSAHLESRQSLVRFFSPEEGAQQQGGSCCRRLRPSWLPALVLFFSGRRAACAAFACSCTHCLSLMYFVAFVGGGRRGERCKGRLLPCSSPNAPNIHRSSAVALSLPLLIFARFAR